MRKTALYRILKDVSNLKIRGELLADTRNVLKYIADEIGVLGKKNHSPMVLHKTC